jgi:hypothetical protein
MAVEPGCEQSRWLPVAVDERRPDVPPEYRGPVVAAAGIAAAQVATVLPEPVPQGGAAGSSQACVPTRTTRLLLSLRTSPSSKKK